MDHPVTAIYDANILYPAPIRDLFIRLAAAGLVIGRLGITPFRGMYYFGARPVQFVDLVQEFLRAAVTVMPAKAGIQGKGEHGWIPACEKMTCRCARMTVRGVLESFVLLS